MNITEVVSIGKDGGMKPDGLWRKVFLALVIMLVALLSFGLGRLSAVGKSKPIKIEYDSSLSIESPIQKSQTAGVINARGEGIVASRNGSKYHYPHCAGAKQIKEENKITFDSKEAAESSGYTLAANCKPK